MTIKNEGKVSKSHKGDCIFEKNWWCECVRKVFGAFFTLLLMRERRLVVVTVCWCCGTLLDQLIDVTTDLLECVKFHTSLWTKLLTLYISLMIWKFWEIADQNSFSCVEIRTWRQTTTTCRNKLPSLAFGLSNNNSRCSFFLRIFIECY